MTTPIESFELDEGYDQYGVHTSVKFEGDQVIRKRTFDAQPMLERCRTERIATSGERWGDTRKVGTMPMAVYAKYLTITDTKERQKYIARWLRENPAFVSFDKFLK